MQSTDHADLLADLRLLAPRGRDTSPDDQADQIQLYLRKLRGYHHQDVRQALSRTYKFWPSWSEIEEQLERAKDARTATLRAAASLDRQPSLSDSANTAVGLLSNAHLRELDRLSPEARQAVVAQMAQWFLSSTPEARAGKSQRERLPFILALNQWIEARLGRSWARILDDEAAARGPQPAPTPGFVTAGKIAA